MTQLSRPTGSLHWSLTVDARPTRYRSIFEAEGGRAMLQARITKAETLICQERSESYQYNFVFRLRDLSIYLTLTVMYGFQAMQNNVHTLQKLADFHQRSAMTNIEDVTAL